MMKRLRSSLLLVGLVAAGCHHAEPTPPPPDTQQPQPPPPASQQPAPVPNQPSAPAPIHESQALPKGARLTEDQAEQVALAFAAQHGMPGAHEKKAEFKNGAWVFKLRGPGTTPTAENKMDVVVDNNGQVKSWALIPYGSPGWNQPD